MLVRRGLIGAAVAELSELLEIPRMRPEVDKLIAQCAALRAARVASRKKVPGPWSADTWDGQDWQVAPAGSEVTVIAFCAKEPLGPYVDFMQHHFQRNRVNAIYVHDSREVRYLAGVKGLGAGRHETSRALERWVADLGTRWLICFGLSSGGYGALRYAVDLGADGVLALSPVISPAPDKERPQPNLELPWYLPGTVVDDLARLYSATAAKPPVTWIVYGGENPDDVSSAEHMKGLPGVSLQPLPRVTSHNTLLALNQSGEFSALLRTFIAEVKSRKPQGRALLAGQRAQV